MKLYLCVLSSRGAMIHTTRTTRKLNIFLRASHTGERHVEGMTDVILKRVQLELLLDLLVCGHHPSTHHRRKNSNFYYSFRSNGSRASEAITWKLCAMKNELKFFSSSSLSILINNFHLMLWICCYTMRACENIHTMLSSSLLLRFRSFGFLDEWEWCMFCGDDVSRPGASTKANFSSL